jgi:hypothetical protein
MVTSSAWPFAAVLAASLTACAPVSTTTAPSTPGVLRPASGAPIALRDLAADRDATVVVFWSAECPCVRRYQERVDALLDTYPADRVRVVGVSSNAGEAFEGVLAAAKERGVRIPIYRDEDGSIAHALGAVSTPTVAVLDRRGAVRFLGWLDNEHKPGTAGRERWLDGALTAILDGRADYAARVPVYGCPITRAAFAGPLPPCCAKNPNANGAP